MARSPRRAPASSRPAAAPDFPAAERAAPAPAAPALAAPALAAPDQPARLPLAAALDLSAAGPLAAELAARRGTDLDLDASAVRRLGAQPLQVLLAALACWRADGAALRVVAPSAAFLDGLAALGAASLVPCHADA